MSNYNNHFYSMFPSGNPNFSSHLSTMNNPNFLQALFAQQQLQQASRENQQFPSPNVHRQQSQAPSTTAAQSSMAFLAALQQLNQQEQNKALAQQFPQIQNLLGNTDLSRLHPQHLQMLHQLQTAAAATSRPTLSSQTNQSQLNTNNLIKQEPKQMYGLTSGIPPYRSNAVNNLSVSNALMRTPDINNTSPAPNRGNNLLSNFQAAHTSAHTLIDGPLKQELVAIRDRLAKVDEDGRQFDGQLTTITKRKQHLTQMLQNRREEMKREREEAEAIRRAAANAEANKNKVSLIDSIAMENRQQVEKNIPPPEKILPKTSYCHDLTSIFENYKRIAPALIRSMTESKINAQQKRQEYLDQYEEKYVTWTKRVDKAEKTPKKIARDQKNRELFEKIFPEIKKEREEKERNERYERNSSEGPPKSKEEKTAERACHVPLYCPQRPRHPFRNVNNEIDEQELKNVNEDISTFLNQWSKEEKDVFKDKIRSYWKNFHVLSHFYWDKTPCDLVKFFYATKTDAKYKLTFPKTKKKIAKAYRPTPMPDFREMYDYLMHTCDQKSTFKKLPCLICSNDVHLFGDILPKMRPEKEKLRYKIMREQEYREKMSICNKCYNSCKKVSLRCPVGECGNGRRRNKPSRSLPSEFVELPVEEQCLIVKKLQFHPLVPKICNNCYKRILTEIKCIRTGTFTIESSLQNHRSDNKKQLKWSFDRVESLFRAASESENNWDLVASQICAENFKPSARQCRVVYIKLSNYWQIRTRRLYLEKSSRRLRHLYRRIRRTATVDHKKSATENKSFSKLSVKLSSTTLDKNYQTPTSAHSMKHGSITQGIPLSRTPTNLPTTNPLVLSNLIPSTSTATSSLVQPQMIDNNLIEYLVEELQISKTGSNTDYSTEITQRLKQMMPHEFEMLSNRLKARTRQQQEPSIVSTFKPVHNLDQFDKNNLRSTENQAAFQFTPAKSVTPDESSRQTNSSERPNRKTGLANVILESNNSGFRSRTHTLQKSMMNRPSSAFDSLHTQPIKSEPTDTSTDTEDSKLKQSKTPYQRNTILNTTISNPKISNNEDEEPAYESLSDDDDPSDSKASKDPNSSSISQKTRWKRLYTHFTLADTERQNIPTLQQQLKMPEIESLGISSRYEDLSD